MITREDIRELAAFQSNGDGCALSFYFQPRTPQNRSHKEESILAKDLVRQALRESEQHGNSGCAKQDLERILDIANHLHGGARAKAIFAGRAAETVRGAGGSPAGKVLRSSVRPTQGAWRIVPQSAARPQRWVCGV